MNTVRCFIRKSSPEIINELKKLGYAIMYGYKIEGIEIYTTTYGVAFISIGEDFPEIPVNNIKDIDAYVDCGKNKDLFLAIAALRDDSNMYQWFVANEDCFAFTENGKCINYYDKGKFYLFEEILFDNKENLLNNFHKATVEELIEHFKNK